MGQPVPADDLPSNIVPESDLPDSVRASFQQTAGGAVTGIQREPRLVSEAGGRLAMIGGAGGIGAAIGTAAPEILTGIAGGLRQIPQGARVAPLIESAAIAARSAGRPATALSGAVSGLASETGGQIAETAGAGPVTAEAVRFAAGGITPEALPMARVILDVFKRKLPTTFEAAVDRL